MIDHIPRNCEACKQIILPNRSSDAYSCLKQHQQVCKEMVVDCKFHIYGCQAKIKRSEQQKHEMVDCKHIPCENNKGVILDRCIGCTYVGSWEDHASHKCDKDKKLIDDIELLKLRLDTLIPKSSEISDSHFYLTEKMKYEMSKLL